MTPPPEVRPYDPVSAITGGNGVQWVDIVPGSHGGDVILPADPHRLWFVIVTGSFQFTIAPWSDVAARGWPVTESGTGEPYLFHNASLPGAVTLPWYITTTFDSVQSPGRIVWYRTAG